MLNHTHKVWPVPAALILYALLPIVTSAMRLIEIAGGPVETPDNARFLVMPLQIYLHAGGGILYLILGALQFSQPLRARFPRWHRWSGRVVVLAGAAVAISALWMTETFPDSQTGNPQEVYGLRMLFGLIWLACLALGLVAAIQRDIAAHRAWMMRAYAIGLGGSTTAVLLLPWFLLIGTPPTKLFVLATGAAWVINLIVAQRILSGRVAVKISWAEQARQRI
jgi:uncharacterized membrane protein